MLKRMSMKIIGVIPARYASTRLKGKVLADINGKPMIQHVWERAKESKLLNDLIIASDSEVVIEKARAFGAKAVLTAVHHPSGSDRVAEAVQSLNVDIVVNIQGDEPLIAPTVIDDLVRTLRDDEHCVMATTIKRLSREEDLNDPSVVKVVVDQNQNALYFSRSPIPYDRDRTGWKNVGYYRHLGIYAYRKDFLLNFIKLPKSHLEKIEQLEQLRVLEAGYKIKTVLTDMETIGVDTEEDLNRVRELLKKTRHPERSEGSPR